MARATSTLALAPTITPFSFDNHNIRVILRDAEPWFSASDVCTTLGIKNHRDSLMHLDDDEKGVVSTDTLGGQQKISVVNESGLYALVLRSRKPEARKFAKWVTGEVLPTIRKTGAYAENRTPLTPRRQAFQIIVEGNTVLSSYAIDMDSVAVNFNDDESVKTALQYVPLNRIKRVTELVTGHALSVLDGQLKQQTPSIKNR